MQNVRTELAVHLVFGILDVALSLLDGVIRRLLGILQLLLCVLHGSSTIIVRLLQRGLSFGHRLSWNVNDEWAY